MKRSVSAIVLGLCAAALLAAQDEPPAQTNQGGGGFGGGRGAAAGTVPEPQPYERVITKDAKTTKGLFTVHQIKERYYYEIPKSELGKDFLWNSQIAKTTVGVGYGGGQLTDRVVRWELQRQSGAAGRGQFQRDGRSQAAHRHGGEGRQQRHHHHGASRWPRFPRMATR